LNSTKFDQNRPNSTIEIGLCNLKFQNSNQFEWNCPSLIFMFSILIWPKISLSEKLKKLFLFIFFWKKIFRPFNGWETLSCHWKSKALLFAGIYWQVELHLQIVSHNLHCLQLNFKGPVFESLQQLVYHVMKIL